MAGHIASWIAAAVAVAVVLFPVAVTPFPTHVCATNAPEQAELKVNSSSVRLDASPWGIAFLNQSIAFVAMNFSVGVLDVSDFKPKLLYSLPMPSNYNMNNTNIKGDGYGYRELVISHNKLNIYVATGWGAVILDVERAVQGRNDSYVGALSQGGLAGCSAITLSISAQDDFVFISQEFGNDNTYGFGAVETYNVTRQASGKVTGVYKGYIALGFATIGHQFSRDYRTLFVTSEMDNTATNLNQTSGVVNILDVKTLMTAPGRALINTVESGCHPVRCQISPDGNHLWVSLREANQVLAFDAIKLAANQTTGVRLSTVDTGTSPIGMAAVGNYILTADSNRFDYTNTSTGVTVIGTGAALKGRVTFPQIKTAAFPRAMAVSPNGNKLLISEFDGESVRSVDVRILNTADT